MATRFGIPAYILALAFFGMTGAPASSQTWTMQVDVDGKRYVGSPIAWDSSQLLLLGRSGHLWQLSKSKAENFKKVSGGFSPFSQGEMRGQLLAEFGKSHYKVGMVCNRSGLSLAMLKKYPEVSPPFPW